ncbi:unnamed protein product [Auanema sp. JU1783]|nr:unnamed protein product [Auanema sp. JU1783]
MFLILLVLLFSAYFLYQLKRRAQLPPGPVPLHLLGNLPQFGYYTWKEGGVVNGLRAFQKEYGDVFTIWLGPVPTVHICTIELAHELMVKQGNNFADRWAPFMFQYLREGKGIIVSNGDYWQEQRRFTLQTLRNFGVGRNLIEERIMMEVDLRCNELDNEIKSSGGVIDPRKFTDLLIGSIINRLLFSVRFTEDNQGEFFHLKHKLDKVTADVNFSDMFINEWLIKLPYFKQRYESIALPTNDLLKFVEKQVDERLTAVSKGEHIITDDGTDYVDAYLKKIEDEKDNPNTTFTKESLLINLLDLWDAGQETTTTTLLWGFTMLLNHPEIENKIREEIHSVTQQSRSLSLKDKSRTPYLNAAVHEIQRHASILNINLFRQVREKTTIGDYIIEPGVPITAELSLIMSDEKNFKNTDQFHPERFIETERLEQSMIPFGIGKRACPGESLARAELYLILGNLIAKYKFSPDGKTPNMKSSNSSAMFQVPDSFSMRVQPFSSDDL